MDLKQLLSSRKATGDEVEYKQSGVFFTFRPFQFLETVQLSPFMSSGNGNVTADLEKFERIAQLINKAVSINTIVGWRNLTAKFIEEVTSSEFEIPQEQKNDPIEYSEENKVMIISGHGAFPGLASNTDFAMWLTSSTFDAATKAEKEFDSQKKT